MPPFRSRAALLPVLAAALAFAAAPLAAEPPDLPELSGPVLLTVSGLDPETYPGGLYFLDLGRLEALGTTGFETSSIWTEGVQHYEGVLLHKLVTALDIGEAELRLQALNDYMIELPTSEIHAEAPLLSFRIDGALLSVRDKGPIWLIYPFDSDAAYRTDTIFARSIWQLDRIEVLR